jgi:hypothetical protein
VFKPLGKVQAFAVALTVVPDTKLGIAMVSKVAEKVTPQPKMPVERFLHVAAFGAEALAPKVPAPAAWVTVAETDPDPAGMLILPPLGVSVMPLTPPVYSEEQLVPDDAQAETVTGVEVHDDSVSCG